MCFLRMKMKLLTKIIFHLFPLCLLAQDLDQKSAKDTFISAEVFFGKTVPANEGFPDVSPQKGVFVNFGNYHFNNTQEWARRLKSPKTGISLGVTDFGQRDSIGYAFTLMPYIEFNAFGLEDFMIKVGTGGSVFTTKYDPVTNPLNEGITTDIVWSFRAFAHYRIIESKKTHWFLGAGYFHHSNGHTRLPNQGLNSFLLSLSAEFTKGNTGVTNHSMSALTPSTYSYASIRSGFGFNVLSEAYNSQKGVYTISGEYGKVFNNTYKLGVGLYYRLYQHYYDYIKDNEFLVRDGAEFSDFKDNPWFNATNLGLHVSGEVLINHIGLELQLGLNFYKPAYQIDWRINQGWDDVPREIPDYFILGEFDSKFKLKRALSSRLGLKYYLINTNKQPNHNYFAGIHINANGGQADFTELSVGYVYNFGLKK